MEAIPTSESYLEKLEAVKMELEALPLVHAVILYPENGSIPATWNHMGVRLSLPAAFVEKKSRRQPNVHCSTERPTHLDALLAMKEKLTREYSAELRAAAAAAAAPATAFTSQMGRGAHPSGSSAVRLSTMERMRAGTLAHEGLQRSVREAEGLLASARAQEKKAIATRLAAEASFNVAVRNLKKFEPRCARASPNKRQRVSGAHTSSPAATSSPACSEHAIEDEGEKPGYCAFWSQAEWRRQETWIWRRRRRPLSDEIHSQQPSKQPRGQRDGPLDHERRGLVGAVLDWAEGSKMDAIKLVSALISRLDLKEGVREQVFHAEERAAETDRIIVDNYVQAIKIRSKCRTEKQRQEHGTLLAGAAPSKAPARDPKGLERRIASRLQTY